MRFRSSYSGLFQYIHDSYERKKSNTLNQLYVIFAFSWQLSFQGNAFVDRTSSLAIEQ